MGKDRTFGDARLGLANFSAGSTQARGMNIDKVKAGKGKIDWSKTPQLNPDGTPRKILLPTKKSMVVSGKKLLTVDDLLKVLIPLKGKNLPVYTTSNHLGYNVKDVYVEDSVDGRNYDGVKNNYPVDNGVENKEYYARAVYLELENMGLW